MILVPFGQTLRLWRQARGLTQEQLARRANVPRPNVSAMERGKREVTLGTLRALAVGLGLRPGVLADGTAPLRLEQGRTSLSREALERIADAVVSGAATPHQDERVLAEALRHVTVHRFAAGGVRLGRRRVGKRQTEAAWLLLESACPPGVLPSLLHRIADRQRLR